MSIYGVAVVDRHGNVGHWFTGSGRESDQCDRDHCCQCFHLVFFLVGWRPNEKKLSHRWRKRALLRSLVLKAYESYLPERPAVGWSDWLGLVWRR